MPIWSQVQRMARAEQRALQDHLLAHYVREKLYPFSPFYRQMFEQKQPPAAALRQAQLALWRQDRWRAPFYWAAFVLLGDPD